MTSAAISIRGVSKRYQLGGAGEHGDYRTLRESIMSAVGGLARRGRTPDATEKGNTSDSSELWALRDVSFDVAPGEVVGLIGRNGAGKSTLLKVLSRITPPTGGRVGLRGRVGSLLEVGTGFHPELTGRENIYLNGAILGMSGREIGRKFDEITAFAEIERFLDTPVKRYSSGMYTRLAFAVASHLEPEILIVDEVLAVGDAQFQAKCLGRMNQVSREGRTVLFVSHNMAALKALCTRGVLLEAGCVVHDGGIDEAVNRYLATGSRGTQAGVIPDDAPRYSDVPGEARVRTVRLQDRKGTDAEQVYFGEPLRIGIKCELARPIVDAQIEISLSTLDGTHVICSTTSDGGRPPLSLPAGTHEFWATLDVVLLPRDYTIDVGIHHVSNGATADFVQRTLNFTVLRVAEQGDDHYRWPKTRGLVRAPTRWSSRPGIESEAQA
ncbi:MAG TPA: ABC transporter ATP-binding protein [Tepidisphaeraceae bacterium]|jgi:lipopolysaccharide transport system ATP-binding protein